MATARLSARTHSPELAGRPSAPRRGRGRVDGRSLLIPLESGAARLAVVVSTLAAVLLAGWTIVRPAVADWMAARAETLGDLERAVAWDPSNPDLRLRLGTAYLDAGPGRGDLGAARRHLQAALRQRPTDGLTWVRLAGLAAREQRSQEARGALEAALRLDRHNVTLRWEAALLHLEWGERRAAIDHLRYVLEFDLGQRQLAFQLLQALASPGERGEALMPSEPGALIALLAGAVHGRDAALAQAAWERRAPMQPPVPASLARRYIELLVDEGHGVAARRAWSVIAGEPPAESRANAVWNGGFENDTLLGWGLDWQIRPVWGVDVQLDRGVAASGRQSLRLAFNSFPTLEFSGVQQRVPVEAGHEYRLRARARASEFITRSGVKLEVLAPDGEQVLGATPAVAGTSEWLTLEARVQIPAGTSFALVRVRREKAPGPEGNLGGRVWIDDVSLTRG